jgi:hypothetical protein
MASDVSMESPATTFAAHGSAKLPANAPSQLKTRCSSAVSRL